jgi:hypothetical protein
MKTHEGETFSKTVIIYFMYRSFSFLTLNPVIITMFINANVVERQAIFFYKVFKDNLSWLKYQTQQPNQQNPRSQGHASQKIIDFQHFGQKNHLLLL